MYQRILLVCVSSLIVGGQRSLRVVNSVSWSSLVEHRENWTNCNDVYQRQQLNKKWDLCYEVTTENYGGDYRKHTISSPNKIIDEEPDYFYFRNCFCDKDCGVYGDCCLDAAEQASLDEIDGDQDKWICAKLPGSVTLKSIYVIGKCTKGWNDEEIRTKCEIDENQSSDIDYTQQIPVLSKDTNVTYRNMYCAACNHDNNLKEWHISIICNLEIEPWELTKGDYLTEENYYPKYRHWFFLHNGTEVKCWIKVEEFYQDYKYDEKYSARACKTAVKTCHPDWPEKKDWERCRMYASYMYTENDGSDNNLSVYNNIFCARCNRVPLKKLICISSPVLLRQGFSHSSLSVLIDFNLNSGGTVGSRTNCKPGEIYDPLGKRCLVVHCGRLFKLKGGKCVRDLDVPFYNNSLLVDCPTMEIPPEDYTVFSNNTVWVNSTGILYDTGEYELSRSNNDSSPMILLVCREEQIMERLFKFSSSQGIVSEICSYISIVCLVLHITSYTIVPKLRNLPGKNLLSLSCSLLVAQCLFLFGIDNTHLDLFCSVIGVAMHFFFLAYFFWMNVMAFDICRTFNSDTYRPSMGSKAFLRYSCYAWWTPTLIVTISVIVDNVGKIDSSFRPGYGKILCWFTQKKALILFFALPVGIIEIANVVLFIITAYNIRKSAKLASRATKRSDGIRYFLYVKLAIIMGLTWSLAFIGALVESEGVWYAYIVFNGLQGAFIFVAFTCKRKVYDLVIESLSSDRLSSLTLRSNRSGTKTSSITLSTNLSSSSQRNTIDVNEKRRSNMEVSMTSSSEAYPPSKVSRRLAKSPNESDV